MQAIITKYLGPTGTRSSRVRAAAAAGNMTVPWNHELDNEGNHAAAANILRAHLGWKGNLVTGCLPSGDYAHVFITRED